MKKYQANNTCARRKRISYKSILYKDYDNEVYGKTHNDKQYTDFI